MAGAVKITRTDMSAKELRFAARRSINSRVVRRILAMALVLEGGARDGSSQRRHGSSNAP
jgi:hypothetical protein